MKNERVLSYTLAQKLTEEDLSSISGAGSGYGSHIETLHGQDNIDDSWHDMLD